MFGTIASTSYHPLLNWISISTLTNPDIRMLKYKSNYTSRISWFDLPKTLHPVFEPEPFDAFDSIGAVLASTLEEQSLHSYVWEQSDVPYPRNHYWTKAAVYGGGLELDHPLFGDSWTKYWGAHPWFNCDSEQPWECEG